jgi:hypothetical protein
MGRHRKPRTAQEKVRSVIAWARRAGFHNIAGALQNALLLLPHEDEYVRAEVTQAARR